MSASAGYFGLRPTYHPTGLTRAVVMQQTKTLIEATPTLRKWQPCALDTSGRLTTVAANNVDMLGVFLGVEYTDLATGRPAIATQWVNGTTVKDLGADSARVIYTEDPTIVYEIQANAALAASAVGDQIGFGQFTTGDSTIGVSQANADVATLAGAGVQSMLRILGIAPYVDNAWADSFPIIQVQIARHQFIGNKVAI